VQEYRNKAGELVSTYHRYRCFPRGSETFHVIKLTEEAVAAGKLAPLTPPPACPQHPRAHVTRAGTYQRKGVKRQRYRCYGGPHGTSHRFCPPLPRAAVPIGQECSSCHNALGVHQGDSVAARAFQADPHLVARAIIQVAGGLSYAKTGVLARMSRDGLKAKPRSYDSWRLAADWTESFVPPLWEQWSGEQTDALEEWRKRTRMPVVGVIDDVPLYNRKRDGDKGGRQRFAVIALGLVSFGPDGTRGETSLRLLRAFPDHSMESYKLLLREAGGLDFIVADGAYPIWSAIRDYQAEADRTATYILSEFHIKAQLRRALGRMRLAQPSFYPGPLADQLDSGALLNDLGSWRAWWRALATLQASQKVPEDAWPKRWVDRYYDIVETQLVECARRPQLPRSTGGLESILSGPVAAALTYRRAMFGNQERTNILLDALTMRLAGQLTDEHEVAERISRDAEAHGGYAPRTRQILDARGEPSLLDKGSSKAMLEHLGL
jgi:hypothetical protein